jgi:hypothetical protein
MNRANWMWMRASVALMAAAAAAMKRDAQQMPASPARIGTG